MTTIKLINLRMRNFKAAKDIVIEFGEKTNIFGKNGAGKTTVSDAVNWILFDKMSDGTKADKIRPHDSTGADIDFIDIVVELDMEVDGKPLNIVKTQKQKWVKHSGEIDKVNEGNENSYVVNTIPKKEKDFKEYFSQIISEDLFKFTSNASAFLKQKTADRRNKLFELVSGISDQDVIEANPALATLGAELEKYSIEELLSRSKKAISDYNKEMTSIPARIDEVSKTIVEVDTAELELQKNAIADQIAEIDKQINGTDEVVASIDRLSNEIMNTKFEISDIQRKATDELSEKRKIVQKQLDDVGTKQSELFRSRTNTTRSIQDLEQRIKDSKEKLSSLGAKYTEKKATVFDESQWVFNDSAWIFDEKDTVCPVCDREYDSDKIDQIRADFEAKKAKAKADFDKRKATAVDEFEKAKESELYKINLDGKATSESIAADTKSLDALNVTFEQIKSDTITLNEQNNKFTAQLAEIPTEIDFTDNQEIVKLEAKLTALNEKYESIKDGGASRKVLEQKKADLQTEIQNIQKSIDSADNSAAEDRIEELKGQHKDFAQKIANAEKEQYQLEEFNRAKVKMLTDEINKNFKVVEWKLFEKQVNGGYKEVCVPMVNGNDYGNGLNSGHSIMAEMDIISTLQRINDVSVPVFLDNAERINNFNIPKMDCQLITLSVTEDNELKVEAE